MKETNPINLLIITGDLDHCCGVSSCLYNLIKELKKYSGLNIMLLNTGGDAIDKFKDLQVDLITDNVFSHTRRSGFNFLKSIKKLRKLIKEKKINIVHSHNHYAANIAYFARLSARPGSFGRNASSFLENITLIQTNHGLFPDAGRLKHFIADKYIAVNDQILNYIVQNNFADRRNIELIRCGIPDKDYTHTPYKKSNESIRIFTASRLVKEKGIETFIRAASYLRESFPEVKFSFEIAGLGNYLNDLIKLNNDLNAGVKFAGVIVNIFPKLNEIDFFVMTSHSEGFPLSMVEAGLAKKFIITSRFDGLEYIFQDHNDGLTFEINNHKELAEKILFGISNPDLANKLSLNFHNKVLKLFNADIAAEKHLSLYKKCLSK